MDGEVRRKRILFRSAHRGTKESDILLGPYAEAHLHSMDEDKLNEFEQFLEESDSDIWDWISEAALPPGEKYSALLQRLRKMAQHK